MQGSGRSVGVGGLLGALAAAVSLALSAGMAQASSAPAKTAQKVQPAADIVLRHVLTGRAQDTLADLVMRFNEEQQGRLRVVMQHADALDESERQDLPTMALLEPDDSLHFFQSTPRFKPLHQVMPFAGQKLEARQFFPLMADAVDDGAGHIQALPLGLSLPVFMWNKTALQQAGLNPDEPPQSWFDVQQRAGSLYDAGSTCPLTSSRFSWIHLENVSTQHGEPLLIRDPARKGNAMRARLNSMVDIKHLALLSSWYKARYFQYFGPGSEADQRFLSGECAMITAESALYQEARRAGIEVGVAPIPYYDDMYGANRENLLPGGMGLWVLDKRSKQEYQGVAQFVRFMLRPEVQGEWLRGTGFLPMTPAAMDVLKLRGAPPSLVELATRRLGKVSPAKLRTKHNAGLAQLRSILNEEITNVWANRKPAKEALDVAMHRASTGK